MSISSVGQALTISRADHCHSLAIGLDLSPRPHNIYRTFLVQKAQLLVVLEHKCCIGEIGGRLEIADLSSARYGKDNLYLKYGLFKDD
jgi:hypothetical protein